MYCKIATFRTLVFQNIIFSLGYLWPHYRHYCLVFNGWTGKSNLKNTNCDHEAASAAVQSAGADQAARDCWLLARVSETRRLRQRNRPRWARRGPTPTAPALRPRNDKRPTIRRIRNTRPKQGSTFSIGREFQFTTLI